MSTAFTSARSTMFTVVLGVGLSLAACNGNSSAPVSESATSEAQSTTASVDASVEPRAERVEPTPASSDSPAANLHIPAPPAEADEESRAGLKAFTAHWLDLLSYSYEANDLEPLQAASDPACTFCQDVGTAMTQVYQVGWASGGATTLTDFTTNFTPDAAGAYTADITTTQTEIFYFSGEGWLGSSESQPDTAHIVTARYTGDGWQMIDYATPPVSEAPAG